MLYKGVLISGASGRIDDAVASHNKGGAYFRALGNANPNPPTDNQLALRAAATTVHDAWTGLEENIRTQWYEYGSSQRRTGRTGVRRPLAGYQEFSRANLLRVYGSSVLGIALDMVNAPPVVSPFPSDGLVSIVKDGHHVTLTFDNGEPWWGALAAACLIWVSPPLVATRRYYRSPMHLVASAGPQTTDTVALSLDTGYADHTCWIRLRVSTAEGCLSTERWVRLTAP